MASLTLKTWQDETFSVVFGVGLFVPYCHKSASRVLKKYANDHFVMTQIK